MSKTNYVGSKVVDTSFDLGFQVPLDDYIKASRAIPIRIFQAESETVTSAVSKAITYLTNKREGVVEIPADVNNKAVYLEAIVDKENHIRINYKTTNYRFPINQESRPYSGGDWQIGDVVLNEDTTDQKCIGWICTEAGTPGSWLGFGYIKRWFTEIEKMDALPQPGPMQEGRQVMSGGRIYACKLVDGEYNWYWMDYAYGSTAQRPTTDLRVGLPYFNIETGLPEWYNGAEWVAVAKANHTHPELGGASDNPKYLEVNSTGTQYIYLPGAKGGFLSSLNIKAGGSSWGASPILTSLENLIDIEKFTPVPGNTSSSFRVEDDVVTMTCNVAGADSVVVRLDFDIVIGPGMNYRYFHRETKSDQFITVRVHRGDTYEDYGPTAGDINQNERTLDIYIDEKTEGKLAIEYIFPASTPVNNICQMENIYLIDGNLGYSDGKADFNLADYVSNGLRSLGDDSDEYDGKQLITRVKRETLLSSTDKTYQYLNPSTYLSDEFVLIEFNQTYGTLGRSKYVPADDDTAASDIGSNYSDITVVPYNTAKLGSKTTRLMGISSEGIILISVPLSQMSNHNITSAYDKIRNTYLFIYQINFALKEEIISPMSKYPTPITIYKNGVIYVNDSGCEIDLKYAGNSAAVAKDNADIIDQMLSQRIKYREAAVAWSDTRTWAEAASKNVDWSGE